MIRYLPSDHDQERFETKMIPCMLCFAFLNIQSNELKIKCNKTLSQNNS